ncbi:MAG TPA: methyltransferase [Gemmataceae bacterium]|nr:methyltransferase [Gemmataceae bacterium]
MTVLLRHLFAIAVLPFTVAVLVPIWVARGYGVRPALGQTAGILALQAGGLLLAGVGLLLFGSSLRRFAIEGRGTLAPWDPPRQLVVQGPYRFVRNPMISGVVFVLFGEAALLASIPHAVWALSFVALNLIYIPILEEPQLLARFGDSYREYCRYVPRLVPRLRPWSPSGGARGAA